MQRELVIWGTGGHALVVADVVRLQGLYRIAGFLDDSRPFRGGSEFNGVPVLGTGEALDTLVGQGIRHLLLAFGDCEARLRLARVAREKGFQLATAVHPRAVVAEGVSVGDGTVIAAGAVVNPGAVIGENVIINTLAGVDHECQLEDGVHLSPGVRLAGRVTVGRGSWVGMGASVKERVRIGAGTVIGAGAVVLRDVPDGVVAYGVPARVVKENRLAHANVAQS